MNKIKARREALGLTQEQLAKRAAVSREHISLIENDKHEPNGKTYRRLAKALNCEIQDLL